MYLPQPPESTLTPWRHHVAAELKKCGFWVDAEFVWRAPPPAVIVASAAWLARLGLYPTPSHGAARHTAGDLPVVSHYSYRDVYAAPWGLTLWQRVREEPRTPLDALDMTWGEAMELTTVWQLGGDRALSAILAQRYPRWRRRR